MFLWFCILTSKSVLVNNKISKNFLVILFIFHITFYLPKYWQYHNKILYDTHKIEDCRERICISPLILLSWLWFAICISSRILSPSHHSRFRRNIGWYPHRSRSVQIALSRHRFLTIYQSKSAFLHHIFCLLFCLSEKISQLFIMIFIFYGG